MFEIDVENVCYLIAKSREFEAPSGVVEGDFPENRPDEPVQDIHTADEGDATFDEIKAAGFSNQVQHVRLWKKASAGVL